MDIHHGSQLQKQREDGKRQEVQGHTGWKQKAQKTSPDAAPDISDQMSKGKFDTLPQKVTNGCETLLLQMLQKVNDGAYIQWFFRRYLEANRMYLRSTV